MPDREARIRDRAYDLWDQAGRPAGGAEPFLERARELIAMEETRSADLHSLFLANQQIPDADSIIAAVKWNLDRIRDEEL